MSVPSTKRHANRPCCFIDDEAFLEDHDKDSPEDSEEEEEEEVNQESYEEERDDVKDNNGTQFQGWFQSVKTVDQVLDCSQQVKV